MEQRIKDHVNMLSRAGSYLYNRTDRRMDTADILAAAILRALAGLAVALHWVTFEGQGQ